MIYYSVFYVDQNPLVGFSPLVVPHSDPLAFVLKAKSTSGLFTELALEGIASNHHFDFSTTPYLFLFFYFFASKLPELPFNNNSSSFSGVLWRIFLIFTAGKIEIINLTSKKLN